MPTRRTFVCITLAAIALGSMLAMRQSITTDELDLRTIDHSTRIAKLELELSMLRADLNELKSEPTETKSPETSTPRKTTPTPTQDTGPIPAHDTTTYYFRLTAIRALPKEAALLSRAKKLEENAKKKRAAAAGGTDKFGGALMDAEVQQLIKDAVQFESDAKKLRRRYNSTGYQFSGFDAEGRSVSCSVIGPDARAASKIPHDSIIRATGEIVEYTDDTLVLDDAHVTRLRN